MKEVTQLDETSITKTHALELSLETLDMYEEWMTSKEFAKAFIGLQDTKTVTIDFGTGSIISIEESEIPEFRVVDIDLEKELENVVLEEAVAV